MSPIRPTDPNVVDRLSTAGSRELDAYLLPRLKYLQRYYATAGNPRVVLLATANYAGILGEIPSASSSFQYSQLLAFMSELLLAEGRDKRGLELGLQFIRGAIDILLRGGIVSNDVLKAHVSYTLYLGVIYKALGQFDQSIAELRGGRAALQRKFGLSDIDVVMLDRQEVIMLQDVKAHAGLGERAAEYARQRPMEYYGTVKRIFEFAMNRNKIEDAKRILPEFQRAFSTVKHKVPLLSHVSFAKNVGQFYLQIDNIKKGVSILTETLHHAHALNFHGQKRQIVGLINDVSSDRHQGQMTFLVG